MRAFVVCHDRQFQSLDTYASSPYFGCLQKLTGESQARMRLSYSEDDIGDMPVATELAATRLQKAG